MKMATRRSSLGLELAEANDNDPRNSRQLSKDALLDHVPWPQSPKKNHRERRRSSMLAEEQLMALKTNDNSATPPIEEESGKKQPQNNRLKGWSLLSKEIKQVRDMKKKKSKEEHTTGSTRTGSPGTVARADGASSVDSQALGKSNKLEDQINLQHLVELMRIFHEADENGSDGLDIDEFRAAFGHILGKGKNDQQMAIMFMKIDTNCDGTVDWDEFCTYMLLEYQEKEVMAGEKLLPYPYPMKILNSPMHAAMVSKITYLPVLQRHGHTNSLMSETQPGCDNPDPSNPLTSVSVIIKSDVVYCNNFNVGVVNY